MKPYRLNPGIMIVLLFSGSCLLSLLLPGFQDFRLRSMLPTVQESLLSFIFLLGLCAVGARIILWGNAKAHISYNPLRVFVYGFLILVGSSIITIGIGLQYFRYILTKFESQIPTAPISTGYVNFFAGGINPVIAITGIITVILLWIARFKKQKVETTAVHYQDRLQDIVLIISTLFVTVLSLKIFLGLAFSTILVWWLSLNR